MDNLDKNEMRALIRRLERVERSSPLGFSSVSRGQTEFKGNESLKVTGSGRVTGTWFVDGVLDVAGLLKLIGNSLLTGDMTIGAGGEITIAGDLPMVIGVTSNGRPGVEFPGGILSSSADRIALTAGTSTVGASDTFAAMAHGATSVVLSDEGTTITGKVSMPTVGAPSAGVTLYQVMTDGNGNLYRIPTAEEI